MCYYITVAVHEDDLERLQSTMPKRFRLLSQDHPRFHAMLPDGFHQKVITECNEHCSCGLYRPEFTHIEDIDKELVRLKAEAKGRLVGKQD